VLANTQLAGCAGLIAWGALEVALEGRGGWFTGLPTGFGAASGAVAGLVAITPSCGYVLPMPALAVGAVAASASFFVLKAVRRWAWVEDRLDVFALHGVGGAVGILLTGLLATTRADAPADGAFYGGGGRLLGVQLAGLAATVLLCGAGTTAIYGVVWAGCRLLCGTDPRVPEELAHDVDQSQHGEKAYFRALSQQLLTLHHAHAHGGTAEPFKADAASAAVPRPSLVRFDEESRPASATSNGTEQPRDAVRRRSAIPAAHVQDDSSTSAQIQPPQAAARVFRAAQTASGEFDANGATTPKLPTNHDAAAASAPASAADRLAADLARAAALVGVPMPMPATAIARTISSSHVALSASANEGLTPSPLLERQLEASGVASGAAAAKV
jgi:hypothetical protein